MVIYTKEGRSVEKNKLPDFFSTRLKGYQPYKAFYLPDYSASDDSAADYRTTIYWNPDITDDSRSMKYYNGDLTGRMQVVLEGYTNQGLPFRSVQYYTVGDAGQKSVRREP